MTQAENPPIVPPLIHSATTSAQLGPRPAAPAQTLIPSDDIVSLRQQLPQWPLSYVEINAASQRAELLARWPLLAELEAAAIPDGRTAPEAP